MRCNQLSGPSQSGREVDKLDTGDCPSAPRAIPFVHFRNCVSLRRFDLCRLKANRSLALCTAGKRRRWLTSKRRRLGLCGGRYNASLIGYLWILDMIVRLNDVLLFSGLILIEGESSFQCYAEGIFSRRRPSHDRHSLKQLLRFHARKLQRLLSRCPESVSFLVSFKEFQPGKQIRALL